MITLLAHGEELLQRADGDYIGSPMYSVLAEHVVAIFAVVALVVGARMVRRLAPSRERFARWLGAYRALDLLERLLLWLLAISSAVHAALILSHEPSAYTLLYLVDALALGLVARRLMVGLSWRLWGGLVLIGSILGYAISGMAGEPPDQVGLATKLVELAALAIVLAPTLDRRRVRSSAAIVVLTLITGISAWAGAFQSGDGGHHIGETPVPGVLLPAGEDREPTAGEVAEADHIYHEVVEALAPYSDPAVAAADGYNVDGMYGTSFHASNAAYKSDDHIFDPERPETLVYAVGSDGPVLLGAMFEMDGLRDAGPAPGGPLTVWHAHDHICFSLTPPALAGLVSPFGGCPLGSIAIPMTGEMLHVWTLPGVEEPFGDIDEDWLNEYLAG